MNKKLFLPLVIFITLCIALMVQLFRNSNGDDPKKLESALIGKPVPTFKLESVQDETKMLDEKIIKTGTPRLLTVCVQPATQNTLTSLNLRNKAWKLSASTTKTNVPKQ